MKTINISNLKIDMDEKKYEVRLLNFMEDNFIILPNSKSKLQSFIKECKETQLDIPDAIKDPTEILKRGIVNHNKNFYLPNEDSKIIEDNLAQAAREGKEIPEHILKKMENKRNEIQK